MSIVAREPLPGPLIAGRVRAVVTSAPLTAPSADLFGNSSATT
jgi:hypothetical protein